MYSGLERSETLEAIMAKLWQSIKKEALENDLINTNMNLEHTEDENATLRKAQELDEDILTNWHDRLIQQAQEQEGKR